MTPADSVAELDGVLSRLETALLTPVVSGELESWVEHANQATSELSQKLPTFLKTVLHPQYAEIAKSDQELLTRVQQLIAEDQQLVVDAENFRTHVAGFAKRAAAFRKDEAAGAGERSKVEKEGIDLIVRIKRQRAAADTWLAEAAYRDRGAKD